MTSLRQRMIEDMEIRNFSSNTIESYVFRVAQLAKHFATSLLGGRNPSTVAKARESERNSV